MREARSAMERAAWAAYGERGAYCGGPAGEVDHLISRSRGALPTADNLAPACVDCNQHKGDLTVEEFLSPARRMRRDGQRLDLPADVAKQRWAREIGRLRQAGSTNGSRRESWT